MPKTVTKRTRPPPKGFETIEKELMDFERKMRDAESEPINSKRKMESTWTITRIHHEKNRIIFNAYYKDKTINKELFDWLVEQGYADKALISKWRKAGYERLCCLQCIEKGKTNFGSTCICRVPKDQLPEGKHVECVTCGCHGCASCD